MSLPFICSSPLILLLAIMLLRSLAAISQIHCPQLFDPSLLRNKGGVVLVLISSRKNPKESTYPIGHALPLLSCLYPFSRYYRYAIRLCKSDRHGF
ncbi:hypothetical protein BGW80DRAFT_1314567 [Lactifluus volemus]|nr:hypothetical protein BGW80DRAFT_1314567 [Lactifluus volemus]